MNEEKQVLILNIDDILPNRFQPRIKFNEQAINELAESIKIHGVIQPIVVRKISDKYEIIAGERRYKASIMAGKETIPAIVTSFDDKNSAEIALIENVQRQDLTPIEEAISYKKILDMGYISQGDLGEKLGKKQSTIANKLRLLNLNDEVQEALMDNKISERHARSLLKLNDKNQVMMLNRIINERLTVRKTDEEINKLLNSSEDPSSQKVIEREAPVMNNDILKEFNIPTEPIMEVDNNETIPVENNMLNMTAEQAIQPMQEPMVSVEPSNFNQEQLNTIQPETFNEPVVEEKSINPGFMDVDKIKNEAQDIFVEPEPLANMDELLKPEVELQPVMEQVVQPLPENEVPNTPQGGKFFNFFNFNEPEKNENFIADVEEQQVNMDFGEPLYNNQPVEQNNVNSEISPIDSFSFGSQIDEPTPIEEISNPVEPVQFTTPIQEEQPLVQESENLIDFSQPVNPFALTDEQDFSSQNLNEQPIISEPVQKSYMMDESVQFNEDGEIEVSVEPANEKFVTADMKTVINTIRNCAATIEKYGYKIDTDEIDLTDIYEVTFRIEKM